MNTIYKNITLKTGVKFLENGFVKKENKFNTTFFKNDTFNMTKTDYNNMKNGAFYKNGEIRRRSDLK